MQGCGKRNCLVFLVTFTVIGITIVVYTIHNNIPNMSFTISPMYNKTVVNANNQTVVTPDTQTDKVNCFLLILIVTSVQGLERRKALRETWVDDAQGTEGVEYRFAIGIADIPTSKLSQLHSENEMYNDLLLLPDVVDTYDTLTSKVLRSFVWLDSHYQFSYLLKVDDDTFVVVKSFLEELKARKEAKRAAMDLLYWGCMHVHGSILKSGKNAEDKWFLCDHYLPYASGAGYVLSADLVHLIASTADYLQCYNSEDVSIGVWISAYKVERKDDKRFNWNGGGCKSSEILSHWQSPSNIKKKYHGLHTHGDLCS